MLQGRPRTSTCSHNFFGVRFGVSEIALSAYPTLEIRCELRGQRADCGVHGACYSNPGLGFELVTLTAPRNLIIYRHFFHHRWMPRAQVKD